MQERAGRWFVSLQVEEKRGEPVPASGPPAGIDLGVKTLAICSSNADSHDHYENPKALMRAARKLRGLQKKLARQQKGSNRREVTRKRIAGAHMRVSCIRSDAIHKATSEIVAKARPPPGPARGAVGARRTSRVHSHVSEHLFHCESCGHTADRDDNASDNMLLLAVSSTERINGLGGTVRPAISSGRDPEKRQSEEVA